MGLAALIPWAIPAGLPCPTAVSTAAVTSQRFANPIVQWTLGVTVRMHGPHPSRIWNPVSKAVCWACQFSADRMFYLTVQALGSKTRYSRGELLGSLTDFHVTANFKSELLSRCFQGHRVLWKIHYKKPSASFSNKYNCSVFHLRGFLKQRCSSRSGQSLKRLEIWRVFLCSTSIAQQHLLTMVCVVL